MQDMDISTVVFALLAAFVVWKLRSVLGERSGDEPASRDRPKPMRQSDAPANANAPSDLPASSGDGSPGGAADPAAAAGLEQIVSADPSFRPDQFLEGAKSAYEMIISAFAAGDRQILKDLLSREVLDSFAAAISERETRGHTVQTTFVSIDRARIEDAQVRGRTGQVTVRFESKLITATRDRDGTVVDGSPDRVADVIDVWTFARELGSRDPNWRLVATEAVG